MVESKGSFRDYVHTNRELIAPSLSFTSNERIRFLYQAEYMRNRAPIDRGVVASGGDARAMDRRTFLGEPGNGRIDQKIFCQQGSVLASISDEISIEGGLSYRNGSLLGYSTHADFGARGILPDGRTISRTRRYHNLQWDDLSARIEATAKAETFDLTHDIRIGADRVRHGMDKYMLQARGTAAATILTIDAFEPIYGKTTDALAPLQNQRISFRRESVYAQDLIG